MAESDKSELSQAAASAALDTLAHTLKSRVGGDPDTSYTARLLSRGVSKCAQKLGEEAVETVIAATAGDRDAVISESADLLYHWLVLMTALDIEPQDVYEEIIRRQGLSGLDEKAARRGGN